MKKSINAEWKGNMAFEIEVTGHKITLDAGTDNGGDDKGPRPKPLMMASLAGCTGMDVVSLLKKMRVDFKGINIIVDGDITEEHPKHFSKMHVIYEIKGNNLPLDKIEKAVTMSQEKYCGVSASYKKAMELTFEIKLVDA